jgi:hypothetical protein
VLRSKPKGLREYDDPRNAGEFVNLEQARLVLLIEVMREGKIHLRTDHEGREGE